MAFAEAIARDTAHIITRANSEFGVSVSVWNNTLDPDVDDATATVRGIRFGKSMERVDGGEGQYMQRRITVQVPKAALASVDRLGFVAINDEVFSIQSVSGDDDATWVIVGVREDQTLLGGAENLFGG